MKANTVFISHSSEDKELIDCLVRFLNMSGLPPENIFYTSKPGTGVKSIIPEEIRSNLKQSRLNIVVLSANFYKSATCLNEAGIIWFLEEDRVIFGMPEINPENMAGLLNKDYLLRRLDNRNDLLYLWNKVEENITNIKCDPQNLNDNIDHLIESYSRELTVRSEIEREEESSCSLSSRILSNEFTNTELIILQYFLDKETLWLNANIVELEEWLRENLLNVDKDSLLNALFTLDSCSILCYINNMGERPDVFEMGDETLRELRKLDQKASAYMKKAVESFSFLNR